MNVGQRKLLETLDFAAKPEEALIGAYPEVTLAVFM
jgi:hypothetical protein